MNIQTSFSLTSGLIWVSCYITSGRTTRENIFQTPSYIQGNVCLSPSDGLFPRIYLHGNMFIEPLLSSGWFLDCDWRLACRTYAVTNNAQTSGHWSCCGPRWSTCAWFNVGGFHTNIRFLGPEMDKFMNWKTSVKLMLYKLGNACFAITNMKYCSNTETFRMIYHT
jgi:hypothetical protein